MSSSPPRTSMFRLQKHANHSTIPPIQTVLCFECQMLFSGTKDVRKWDSSQSKTGYILYQTLGSLRQSSPFCRFCKLLWDGLESASRENPIQPRWLDDGVRSVVRIEVPDSAQDNGYQLRFKYPELPFIVIQLIPENTGIPNMEMLSHLRTNRPEADVNTASDTSLELVRAWIGNCLSNHSRCNSTHSPRILPTRLLEIGEKLRLRTSDELPVDTLYTTLSHRWGSEETTCLTQSSYPTFTQQSIPLSSLPLKYQHAISYTHRLGVHYIWIDSLCIIQDSKEDWFQEADRMSSVYSHSYCNISSTAAGDGLFRHRDPTSVAPCRVHPVWNSTDRGSFYCGVTYEWWSEVTEAPLSTRGWVVQERALVPRVLHFGDYQLYWECRQSSASELWPEGMDAWFRTSMNKEDMDLKKSGNGNEAETARMCYRGWRYAVSYYSRCELTYSSDKLVAISGIARAVHDLLGGKDTYLAGLWKNQLLVQLMWRITDTLSLVSRVEPYRAPSWSWASLDTVIHYQGSRVDHATHLARVIDATTTLAGESPFGDVLDGMIRLSGPLFRVRISITENGDVPVSLLARRADVPEGDFKMQVFSDEKITRTTDLDLNIHALMVFQYLPNVSNAVDGLLLQPTCGRIVNGSKRNFKGEFTRFGRFEGIGHEKWAEFAKGKAAFTSSDLKFERDNEDGTYIVTII